MKSMSSKSEEATAMLKVLTPKIEDCTEMLTSNCIRQYLYGLQSMANDNPEVLAMLSILST
jgi:hypothetical protein